MTTTFSSFCDEVDAKSMCWLVMMHPQIILGEVSNCWIVGAGEPALLHRSNQTQLLREGDGNFLAINN
jgi:hypothetical protein